MISSIPEVLVIGRDFHPLGKETAAVIEAGLRPHLEAQGLKSELLLLKDIIFDISNERIRIINGKTGIDLKQYKAVLMVNWLSHASIRKDMAYTLALYFNRNKVPCFNSEALYSRSTSKLSQMMLAALEGVAIPRTVFSLSLKHLSAYLTAERFAVPFILKDAQASRGKSNYVLQDIAQIAEHASEHSETTPFIAQEFIVSEGADFRFFVCAGETKLVIKRIGTGRSHLNNTSAGASTAIIPVEEISPDVIAMVRTMSRRLHREMTGIDIMVDKNTLRPYFLEANPIPQIATGSNVNLKLDALAVALKDIIRGGK